MSVFDDIESDLAASFVDPDVMGGESVTYQPYPPATQAPKVINAIVRRLEPQMESGVERVPVPQIEISIANNALTGVTSINRGADKVLVADRKGGTPTWHVVNNILSQDAGIWRLRLK